MFEHTLSAADQTDSGVFAVSDQQTPKTEMIPVTPIDRASLSEMALETLLGTELHPQVNEATWDWTRLPLCDGRYDLGERIASGGMGTLYAATDKMLSRRVAIKVLRRDKLSDPTAVARFLQEARIHSQFHHPGIPPLHDVGRLPDGRPFLAMKYIRSRTLTEKISESPSTNDLDESLLLFEQACLIIEYAHAKRVLHRDLTPNNVLVSDKGRVQVIDWGLAKVLVAAPRTDSTGLDGTTQMCVPNLNLTDEGLAMGTPAFMAPEFAGGSADTATELSDVFGLGGILCFILTGRPLYAGQISSVMKRVKAGDVTEAFERLDECAAPKELVNVAKTCLSNDLAMRPKSAHALAEAVAKTRTTDRQSNRSWWTRFFNPS